MADKKNTAGNSTGYSAGHSTGHDKKNTAGNSSGIIFGSHNALVYLFVKKFKNKISLLIKSPGKLIYLVLILCFFGFSLFSGLLSGQEEGEAALGTGLELLGYCFIFYALITIVSVPQGFRRGGSFFNMSDVNILFNTPIKSSSILLYGVINQLGSSAIIGVFMLFQFPTLRMNYGIGIGELLLIMLCYTATAFMFQLTATLIYSVISKGKTERATQTRKRLISAALIAFLIGTAIYICFDLLAAVISGAPPASSEVIKMLLLRLDTPVIYALPCLGWIMLIISGMIFGRPLYMLLGAALCILFVILVYYVISKASADFYEDVIGSAEAMQSAITARREGLNPEAAPIKVKLGKTGIRRGKGAGAMFYKHMVEKRRSGVFFLSVSDVIFSVIAIGASYFMSQLGSVALVIILALYNYMGVLTLGSTTRFNRELSKPFIYIIPEPPVKKLIWSLMEIFPSAIIKSGIVMTAVGIITGATVPEIISAIFVNIAAAVLLTVMSVLVDYMLGSYTMKGLSAMLYMMFVMLGFAPGLIAAVIIFVLSHSLFVSLLVLAAITAAVCFIVLLICRNMLYNAEFNNK